MESNVIFVLSIPNATAIEIFYFRSYWLTIRCKSYNGDRATLSSATLAIALTIYILNGFLLSENRIAFVPVIMDKLQILIKLR